MRVRNLVWTLLFFIPGVLFASADLESDQKNDTNVVVNDDLSHVDAVQANDNNALNLEEGASDDWRGWGGWGRWGGGWGRWGGWGSWGGGWGSWGGGWWPVYTWYPWSWYSGWYW